MFLCTVGQNPTGSRLAPERYAAIYSVARKHGLIIVEDDVRDSFEINTIYVCIYIYIYIYMYIYTYIYV